MKTSLWWPLPVRPSIWFSAEQLSESARYHTPLGRIAVARTIARAAGLVGGSVLCRGVLTANEPWSIRFFVATMFITLAWWVPATAADWWFDRVHGPSFGMPALPVEQMAVGSVVALFATVLVVSVGGGTASSLLGVGTGWRVLVGVPIVLVAMMAAWVSARPLQLAQGQRPLLEPVQERFGQLAEQAGLDPGQVGFGLLPPEYEDGLNALTMRARTKSHGPVQHVAVTSGLVAAPTELQRLVVSHELGHLVHRHLGRLAVVASAELVATAGVVTLVLASGQAGFQTAASGDPRGLPEFFGLFWVTSTVFGLATAWYERMQERQADLLALQVAKPTTLEDLRLIHGTNRADLAPRLLSRIFAAHPTPAERLQRASLALGLEH